ncbi:MAG: DEAD/DEAH box helicase, partial [Prevotella sp.]|nr:DEAD/DEAH box helicase [Prevotella sp.]
MFSFLIILRTSHISYVLKAGLKDYKKLLLTATPLQNNVKELFGLISIIDDNFFGSLKSFTERYNKVGLRQDKMYLELHDRISPIIHRTLRRDVQEYVKYTERHPMVQEYYPSDDEIALSELVTEYLQKEACYGMPAGQRTLISLVLHKLLSSSTFAIAGTLKTIIDRLKNIVANDKADDSHRDSIMNYIKNDIDDFEDINEDWTDEDNDDTQPKDETPKYTEQDINDIKGEISELTAIYELALGIATNTKGECLLKALEIAFEDKRKNGQPEKALIFTESNRTQKYLKQLLEDNGYTGKLVLFNGSNSDSDSREIYRKWLDKNKGTSRITGSLTADRRQAIVDYFKNTAQIMIATEAAAEGINLQFCSLVVNYDLPWNPQRVEQRIGRCHRYGQKNDVVVLNFINKANRADQRVYQLLSQKFNLFCGVFGSSDEVLGHTMDGVDFEHRVLDIYQSCRSVYEIDAAFDRLQEEMKDEIDQTIIDTQNKLIENFDKDVVNKLKLRKSVDEYRLSEFYRLLWLLTLSVLHNKIKVIDNKDYHFKLLTPLIVSGETINTGLYQMGKDVNNAYTYRIGHPLAQWVISQAKDIDTTAPVTLTFDYSAFGERISVVEAQKRKSGILKVILVHYVSPKDSEEHLVSTAIDSNGNVMEDDFAAKLMTIPASTAPTLFIDDNSLLPIEAKRIEKLSNEIKNRNREFINEESEKIERWAKD